VDILAAQGPGYTWDQTPESVEARIAAPEGTIGRDVRVEVLPHRIRVAVRDAVLLDGRLTGQVVAADAGDYEWELVPAAGGGGPAILVSMHKRCAQSTGRRHAPHTPSDGRPRASMRACARLWCICVC
jgi:hypothetical protein